MIGPPLQTIARSAGAAWATVDRHGDAVAGSDACRSCHPAQWHSWHDSYHRTMTQLAKSEAILAKWHGTRLPLGQAALQLEHEQKRDDPLDSFEEEAQVASVRHGQAKVAVGAKVVICVVLRGTPV